MLYHRRLTFDAMTGTTRTERCDCPRPWRIKKVTDDPAYPWTVDRYTPDEGYELVMRCTSFDGAASLVRALVWLSIANASATSIVTKGSSHVR